jgi:plastocyanin
MLNRSLRLRPRAVVLSLLALAVLCLASAAADARIASVSVKNDFFGPKAVTIARGDTVKWVWRSHGRKHNVVSSAFGDSGNRRRGTFTVHFTSAGRYTYYCGLHPGMDGTVVVRR